MMWFILILISAAVFGISAGSFIAWCVNCHDYPKIKYKDFQKYYDTHPERWYCGLHTVRYEMSDGSCELFNFGLIGFYRYKLWQHKIDLAEKRKERTESMQRFLDDVNKTEAEND